MLRYAEDGATGLAVLRARGVESEMQLPFAGLYELLRPALHLLGHIPAPRAAALEVALALRPNVSGGDRFAVGAATLSLLAAYAEEAPTLLLIDDAHLLDASSAEAIRFALRRMLAEPLGALLAVREDEASLLDDADLPVLHVAGLDRAAATGLLGGVPAETADRLVSSDRRESPGADGAGAGHVEAGNPFHRRTHPCPGAGHPRFRSTSCAP